jgi:transcriptional regulator with XRE-family HTH domain
MPKSIYTQEQRALQKLLKRLRGRSGLTQESLAERLNLPQSFVSKYESGERRLDVLELRRVCMALAIDFSEFAKLLEKDLKHAA